MKRPHLLRVLHVRAKARAAIWRAEELPRVESAQQWQAALDLALLPLFEWAVQRGLVRHHGEEFVKAIIEAPFLVAADDGLEK